MVSEPCYKSGIPVVKGDRVKFVGGKYPNAGTGTVFGTCNKKVWVEFDVCPSSAPSKKTCVKSSSIVCIGSSATRRVASASTKENNHWVASKSASDSSATRRVASASTKENNHRTSNVQWMASFVDCFPHSFFTVMDASEVRRATCLLGFIAYTFFLVVSLIVTACFAVGFAVGSIMCNNRSRKSSNTNDSRDDGSGGSPIQCRIARSPHGDKGTSDTQESDTQESGSGSLLPDSSNSSSNTLLVNARRLLRFLMYAFFVVVFAIGAFLGLGLLFFIYDVCNTVQIHVAPPLST